MTSRATACHGLPRPATACHGLPRPATACHGLPRPLRPAAACRGLPRPATASAACRGLPRPHAYLIALHTALHSALHMHYIVHYMHTTAEPRPAAACGACSGLPGPARACRARPWPVATCYKLDISALSRYTQCGCASAHVTAPHPVSTHACIRLACVCLF